MPSKVVRMNPDGSFEDPGWRDLAMIPATKPIRISQRKFIMRHVLTTRRTSQIRFCSRTCRHLRENPVLRGWQSRCRIPRWLSGVCTVRGATMSLFSLLLNILWIAFGGLWMAVAWIVAAVIMAITIIGLPWARAAINIGLYT